MKNFLLNYSKDPTAKKKKKKSQITEGKTCVYQDEWFRLKERKKNPPMNGPRQNCQNYELLSGCS